MLRDVWFKGKSHSRLGRKSIALLPILLAWLTSFVKNSYQLFFTPHPSPAPKNTAEKDAFSAVFFYPSRRLGIDARRLANPSLRSLHHRTKCGVYHHALACISSALRAAYHHRRCISLRIDAYRLRYLASFVVNDRQIANIQHCVLIICNTVCCI